MQREEAKITAWENLQKAKAEASVRKLEVPSNFSDDLDQFSFFIFYFCFSSCFVLAVNPLVLQSIEHVSDETGKEEIRVNG